VPADGFKKTRKQDFCFTRQKILGEKFFANIFPAQTPQTHDYFALSRVAEQSLKCCDWINPGRFGTPNGSRRPVSRPG
jgi:hypothetical protein